MLPGKTSIHFSTLSKKKNPFRLPSIMTRVAATRVPRGSSRVGLLGKTDLKEQAPHTPPGNMGILEKIKDIELEMSRTQKNKATEGHLGILKSKLAKLRTELLAPVKAGGSNEGDGFEVSKYGHGRVALIGFPSVGKSTLLTLATGTDSEAAAYEFTTLTCIPGTASMGLSQIRQALAFCRLRRVLALSRGPKD